MIKEIISDDRVSTPMKPSTSAQSPTTSKSATTSDTAFFKTIEARVVQEAEKEVQKLAANHLRKRSSEIMISSDNEEEPENLSFIKWLSPESAKLFKNSFNKIKISESPAKKNLKLK